MPSENISDSSPKGNFYDIEELNDLLTQKDKKIEKLCLEINKLEEKVVGLEGQNEFLVESYRNILNSKFWKLTKPIRWFLDILRKCKRVLKHTSPKALSSDLGLKKIKNGNLTVENFISSEIANSQKNYKFGKNIKFSIVVPLFNTDKLFLKQMIQSVINQTYSNWELCLADASDPSCAYVKEVCEDFSKKDSRVKYKKLEKNIDIAQNTNKAIKMATGDYIAFLDHDDILHPSALFEDMLAIEKHNADFIYTDELNFKDNIDNITFVNLKPDFAIDNLRACNYICHFVCVKKTLVDKIGLLDSNCNGSQDYDFVLRCTEKAENIYHIRKILYFWRVHPGSVTQSLDVKPYCKTSAIKALENHLFRCNINAKVKESKELPYGAYDVTYSLEGRPLVSIIIPNKDHIEDLKRCLNSIISKTTYENYEIIIVENNSEEDETFEYYKELGKNSKIRVVEYKSNGEFNFSAINNFAAKQASGEYLLFLNNDTKVLNSSWLYNMLHLAARKDVGAVGAKLYFKNLTIQHAGVMVEHGIAAHYYSFFSKNNPGYIGRLKSIHNVSAVTGACLMVKKSKFEEVNGFDEEDFKVAYNDIDLCLKLKDKGYLNVFTPFAELIHYESLSRGYDTSGDKKLRLEKEQNNLKEHWKNIIYKSDPYYHPMFIDANFNYKLTPYTCDEIMKGN